MDTELTAQVTLLLTKWDQLSTRSLYFGFSLLILGILCSLAVSIFTDSMKSIHIKLLGFTAAVCTGLLTALHPIEIGNSVREAWRILNSEKLEFAVNKDPERLISAVREGEHIIAVAQNSLTTTAFSDSAGVARAITNSSTKMHSDDQGK